MKGIQDMLQKPTKVKQAAKASTRSVSSKKKDGAAPYDSKKIAHV